MIHTMMYIYNTCLNPNDHQKWNVYIIKYIIVLLIFSIKTSKIRNQNLFIYWHFIEYIHIINISHTLSSGP